MSTLKTVGYILGGTLFVLFLLAGIVKTFRSQDQTTLIHRYLRSSADIANVTGSIMSIEGFKGYTLYGDGTRTTRGKVRGSAAIADVEFSLECISTDTDSGCSLHEMRYTANGTATNSVAIGPLDKWLLAFK